MSKQGKDENGRRRRRVALPDGAVEFPSQSLQIRNVRHASRSLALLRFFASSYLNSLRSLRMRIEFPKSQIHNSESRLWEFGGNLPSPRRLGPFAICYFADPPSLLQLYGVLRFIIIFIHFFLVSNLFFQFQLHNYSLFSLK